MQKNVFEENMIVYVLRTASLRLKLYFLMQRAFAENLQEVILFCIKTLDIRSCVRYNNMRRPGNGHNRICGCGGTGRRARFRF